MNSRIDPPEPGEAVPSVKSRVSSSTPSQAAITVEGLGKTYRLGERGQQQTLREYLTDKFKPRARGRGRRETFWALTDVSFEIPTGQVVGIIGRNGAGKSTLLKILSRITQPTTGRAFIRGRVGSLLDVGTGFHHELTGRENTFLSGAILGMKRAEITARYNAIMDFAELEKFADTPVKFYSSGMYLRLAFAVAAHLEPDVLLVDEALAVGDSAFQRKCLGRMNEVAATGRTVLFVSHSLPSIVSLCDRTILLERGRVKMDGATREVVEKYVAEGLATGAETTWAPGTGPGSEFAEIRAVRIKDEAGKVSGTHDIARPVTLEMDFYCKKDGTRLNASFQVHNAMDLLLFATANFHEPNWGGRVYSEGLYRTQCTIPGRFLAAGLHKLSCLLMKDGRPGAGMIANVLAFETIDDGEGIGDYRGPSLGVVRPVLPWLTHPDDGGASD